MKKPEIPCIAVDVPCGPGQVKTCTYPPGDRCFCRCVDIPAAATVPTLNGIGTLLFTVFLLAAALRRLRS